MKYDKQPIVYLFSLTYTYFSSIYNNRYIIIWLGSFFNGMGYTAFYTLGFPYVDDNVSDVMNINMINIFNYFYNIIQ